MWNIRCCKGVVSGLAFVLACAATSAWAQPSYPAKPVRILAGMAPGGFTDIAARIVAQKLADALAQPFVVDNRPGANGGIAAELTARAAPDGYTLYMASPGHTINPLLQKVQYDALKDFTAVARVADIPNLLVVHPSVPARSVKELLAHAKAHPGKFTQASSGIGSPGHLSGELLQMMTGTKFVHVPYKGSGLALVDLISGHVDLSFPTTAAGLPHVKAGKLRPLGVTSATRSGLYPDVPAIAEAAVPGFEVVGWYGLIGPAGMADAALSRLTTEMAQILKMADVRERIVGAGAEPVVTSRADFAAYLARDQQKWAKVIKAANIPRADGK